MLYCLQKVPAGGIQEKLTSAYRSVHDVVSDEDATLGRCNAAVIRVDGLEKEANTVRSSRKFFISYTHVRACVFVHKAHSQVSRMVYLKRTTRLQTPRSTSSNVDCERELR